MPPCTLPFQKNLLEVAPRHYNLLRQLLTYSHVIMPILQEDYFVQGNQKLSLKMEEKKKKKPSGVTLLSPDILDLGTVM